MLKEELETRYSRLILERELYKKGALVSEQTIKQLEYDKKQIELELQDKIVELEHVKKELLILSAKYTAFLELSRIIKPNMEELTNV